MGTKLKIASRALVIKYLDDVPMHVVFVSHDPVNLLLTFEHRALGVPDFNKK